MARVDGNGLVTSIAAGSASISATSEGRSGSAALTVLPAPVAHASVTLAASSLTVGQTTQASATLTDASGSVLTGRAITWASSNASVAAVNSSGLVTAVAAGTANINATSQGVTGAATLFVTAPSPPPATGEPMFQTGTDVSLFTENFESFSNLTALLTYNSSLARYTSYGQQ